MLIKETEIISTDILKEIYYIYLEEPKKLKIMNKGELKGNILLSIEYRRLEAQEYLRISYCGSQHYSVKITALGIEFLNKGFYNL